MVRFTAMREFNALEDDWPLDYMSIDDAPDQPRSVLAAAISSEMVRQIVGTCHTAGLKPRRLILRPCGAASLYCRQQADGRPKARLLVELLVDEADLTVIIDRKVIFLRTARLPGDPLTDAEAGQALLAEFRRTMAAVQNQLGGARWRRSCSAGSARNTTSWRPRSTAVWRSRPRSSIRSAVDAGGGVGAVAAGATGPVCPAVGHVARRASAPAPRRRFPPSAEASGAAKQAEVPYRRGGGRAALFLLLGTASFLWCKSLDAEIEAFRGNVPGGDHRVGIAQGGPEGRQGNQDVEGQRPDLARRIRWFITRLPSDKV